MIGGMNPPISPPPLVIRSHPQCLEHRPGLGHPDSPDRLQVVLDAVSSRVEGRWSVDRESALPSEDDVLGCLAWIHDKEYIERVRTASTKGNGWLDSQDCGVSPGTFDAAVAAAGLAMQAALDLVNNRLTRAFVVARPPSHHAHRDRASGYCFFNSAALAAEVITRSWVRPVVIADFGALHGDGTQEMFFDRGDVGCISVHRYPAFPGTGGADEVGDGPGRGLTRNVPLAAGSGDDVVCFAFEKALNEICGLLQPAAIVVSAGFDAHPQDVLGGLRVTEDGFRRLSAAVRQAAETSSGGRIVSILEGGFHLEALAKNARIHAEELSKSSSEKPLSE